MTGATSSQSSYRPVGVEELEVLLGRLRLADDELDSTGTVDQIDVLERLKGACAGAQARLTRRYADRRREELRGSGVCEANATRSIAAELALARRESPVRGRSHLRLARALVEEMPVTYAALQEGRITEHAAGLVVRATNGLSTQDRAAVDARLAASLGSVSESRLESTARAYAYELDPEAFVRRARKAIGDRRVTIRPAPDVMAYVTALLPVEEGVACYAALTQRADALRASGDDRTRQQIAADTFVERVTGRSPADGVDVEVQVVMTDRSLFSGADTPCRVPGFGPVPADLARDLARKGSTRTDVPDDELREVARAWIRRVFLAPEDDSVRDMDPRRRSFAGRLRRLVVARDQVCRTPWCGAPVRHADHVVPVASGGRTRKQNGQGLCETCNYVKETLGWSSRVVRLADGTDVVETTTPTGHTYRSSAPPVLDAMETLGAEWDDGQESREDPASRARGDPASPEADLREALEAWQHLVDSQDAMTGPGGQDDLDRDFTGDVGDEDWAKLWDVDGPELAG